jgi:hypothetical protein
MKIPDELLDSEGYPTDGYLKFIENYTNETMPIIEFIYILMDGWYFGNWGFFLHKKYKGIRKFELHTGGWSGNDEIIRKILSNIWLTNFKMKYVSWRTGGHYYFEIKID